MKSPTVTYTVTFRGGHKMRNLEKFLVLSAAAFGLMISVSQRAEAVSVTIGNAEGAPGDFVPVEVTLQTEGEEVAGTQNDIIFPAGREVAVAADDDDDPLCEPNEEIEKNGTTFAFIPNGCTPGDTCTGVRALVLALNNVDPIPDGSVLYTCELAIAEDADQGAYTLNNMNAGSSSPEGLALETEGIAGVTTVSGGGTADATIVIGSATGEAPGNAVIEVRLNTGVEVAGTQNDITFTPQAGIRADDDGDPVCAANEDIEKNGTTFAFLPNGCTPGDTCTGVRALVLALNNVDPIPDGSVLYTCDIAIAADATGEIPLTCSNAGSSSPAGGALNTDCTNGTITIGGATPTNTVGEATATSTPTTGGATPTNTVGGNTPTRTNTTGPIPPTFVCDDGCSVAAPVDTTTGWVLLLPAALLLWVRRRSH